ncbi:MAG: peptidoglycan DD-metalloendopeptidase family protein [Candidatus Pacebacteria bacterium]|nr:peptidoglycan DD-metalloendopeptidase family protein [Candidatus Paceibacterota bacterium]
MSSLHILKSSTRVTQSILAGFFVCVLLTLSVFLSSQPSKVAAEETVTELRAKIEQGQAELRKIEAEIAKYEHELTTVGAEKKTLQSAIHELDLARKKIQGDVRATEQKITTTDLEIEELSREIQIKELEILRDQEAVAASFREIDIYENQSMVEMLFAYNSLAEVWSVLEYQTVLRDSLRDDMRTLDALKKEYENAQARSLSKRADLSALKGELSGEQKALDQTRTHKDVLLKKTKNQEAGYQQLLSEKKAAREKFEKEMAAYEAQIKFILNPTTIPPAGSGVLKWPIDGVFMGGCAGRSSTYGNAHCITQYFGNTAFAQSGAYNGNGHNGIDFGIPQGTKILAALGGKVVETGNTDAVPGCMSYGKWILLQHANGLSTLYAHLSAVSVTTGEQVTKGQLIGYSGNTGYSTGPHLHFTLFASAGVNVVRLGDVKAITSCGPARVPVAGYEAYLNPMSYL